MIVIAHRFSTIRRASAIFTLEKGQVVESGTHEQLIAAGLYAKLFELQFRQTEIWRGATVAQAQAQSAAGPESDAS